MVWSGDGARGRAGSNLARLRLNRSCIAECGVGGGHAAKFSAARPRSHDSKTATNQVDCKRKPPAPLAGEPFAE